MRRGQLYVRCVSPVHALYRGLRLVPADAEDPYAFRLDLSAFGLGDAGQVFFACPGGRTRMHFDLNPITVTRRL